MGDYLSAEKPHATAKAMTTTAMKPMRTYTQPSAEYAQHASPSGDRRNLNTAYPTPRNSASMTTPDMGYMNSSIALTSLSVSLRWRIMCVKSWAFSDTS